MVLLVIDIFKSDVYLIFIYWMLTDIRLDILHEPSVGMLELSNLKWNS